MTEEASRGYLSLTDRSFQLPPFENVCNNDLCSRCAALNISIIITPHGQPHVESVRCLQRSAEHCPLCNFFALSIFLKFEATGSVGRYNDSPLICRMKLQDGISFIYLAYPHNPVESLCTLEMEFRVFTTEGIASPI